LAKSDDATHEEFIREAIWHGSLDRAEALLAKHPELARNDIHIAAILGDDAAVRRFIAANPANVKAKSGPFGGDALNYLGLSKYLRLKPERTDAFVRAATALLDAGADPNTGFWTGGEFPEYETAMYGAAGVAHNPEVTALLLERGADPNDGEVVYHSPETGDNRCIELLVGTGKLTKENLGMMLIRKIDWHDEDGLRYLLEHGAPADGERNRGWRALHHALARGNELPAITSLLDHGADPTQESGGFTATEMAARLGRSDVLAEFAKRGHAMEFTGVDRLIAMCATGDADGARMLWAREPALLQQLLASGGTLLAMFARSGNVDGVRVLLDLGVSPTAPFVDGDGYFEFKPNTLPIYVAAKLYRREIVQLLIDRGSPTDATVERLLSMKGRWWENPADPS
jgi:ankyrin repeat protein